MELAETTLDSIKSRPGQEKEARRKCSECLETGMENWNAMVKTMLKEEKERKASGVVKAVERPSRWFWGGGAGKQEVREEDEAERWERESKMVGRKLREVKEMVMEREEKEKIEGRGVLGTLLGV